MIRRIIRWFKPDAAPTRTDDTYQIALRESLR